MLENGKQTPVLELFNKVCNLASKSTEEYFKETTEEDSLVYLKGSLEDADKVKIEEMAERIRVKEKSAYLEKRSRYFKH